MATEDEGCGFDPDGVEDIDLPAFALQDRVSGLYFGDVGVTDRGDWVERARAATWPTHAEAERFKRDRELLTCDIIDLGL